MGLIALCLAHPAPTTRALPSTPALQNIQRSPPSTSRVTSAAPFGSFASSCSTSVLRCAVRHMSFSTALWHSSSSSDGSTSGGHSRVKGGALSSSGSAFYGASNPVRVYSSAPHAGDQLSRAVEGTGAETGVAPDSPATLAPSSLPLGAAVESPLESSEVALSPSPETPAATAAALVESPAAADSQSSPPPFEKKASKQRQWKGPPPGLPRASVLRQSDVDAESGAELDSPSQQAQEAQQQQPKKQWRGPRVPPEEARLRAFSRAVPALFHVKGVSFEDRQDLLTGVHKDTPLLLRPEPDNPHDPAAMAVHTLAGHRIGYVPRESTGVFAGSEETLAYVESIGQAADSGLVGVKVAAYPGIPPLTVDAPPDGLARHMRLSRVLPAEDWNELRTSAYHRAGYRCEISGGTGEEKPVAATGIWLPQQERKVMQLVRVEALAPALVRVKTLGAAEGGHDAAATLLCAINRWSLDDTESYLRYIEMLRMLRSREEWRLDLSWLQTQGIAVPLSLVPFCI